MSRNGRSSARLRSTPANQARLIQANEDGVATVRNRVPLDHDLTFGREAMPGQVVLDHPNVSRCHAAFELVDGTIVLRDLGSANGTYVNGERLRGARPLIQGDRIDIGPFQLTFDGTALTRMGALAMSSSGYWLTEAMRSVFLAAEEPISIVNPRTGILMEMTAKPASHGAAIVVVHAVTFLLIAYLVTLVRHGRHR